MIAFTFKRVSPAVPTLQSEWDILLGFAGDLVVEYGDLVVASEEAMPVVELAEQLVEWVMATRTAERDFVFASQEYEQDVVVSIRRVEGGWRIQTLTSETENLQVGLATLRLAVRKSLIQLRDQLLATHGREIASVTFQIAPSLKLFDPAAGWLTDNAPTDQRI